MEVIRPNPIPPDRATSSPTEVNKHSPYLLGSLGKTPQPSYPESPAP